MGGREKGGRLGREGRGSPFPFPFRAFLADLCTDTSSPKKNGERDFIWGAAASVHRLGNTNPKQRRRRQRERNKSNRLAKQQLCTCTTLFCTFLCRYCTTTTWKCLISRFVEDVNTRQRLSSSFSELRYSLFKIQLQKKMPRFDELNEVE